MRGFGVVVRGGGVVCLLGVALFVGLLQGPVVWAGSQGAYFTSVLATDGNGQRQVLDGSMAKVYSNQAPVFEDTVFFNNVTASPSSTFYEVIYLTYGPTTLSFTGDLVTVSSGASGAFNWQESGGFGGSGYVNIRIELWLNSSVKPILESSVSFDFFVVLLTVNGWLQSQVAVQRGLSIPAELAVNFTNGGNDVMYNSSLAVLNASGVTVQPYGYSLGDLQVGGSARGVFNVSATQGLSFGPLQILFRISFADFRGVQHSVNETVVIDLTQLGTQITISPSVPRVNVNAYASIKISLVDNNGDSVSDAKIAVYIGNLPPLSLQTDSYGNAVYQYQAKNGSGVFLLRATFAGDASLAPSAGSSILIVNPLSTTLTLSVPNDLSLGQSTTLSAALLDATGHPVIGANVTFLVNGKGVGWGLTDTSGVAVLYYYLEASGYLNLRASFVGDDTYQGADSPVATVNVAPVSLFVVWGVDLTFPVFLVFAFSVLVLAARSLIASRKLHDEIK
jgi:hypothetical protein